MNPPELPEQVNQTTLNAFQFENNRLREELNQLREENEQLKNAPKAGFFGVGKEVANLVNQNNALLKSLEKNIVIKRVEEAELEELRRENMMLRGVSSLEMPLVLALEDLKVSSVLNDMAEAIKNGDTEALDKKLEDFRRFEEIVKKITESS